MVWKSKNFPRKLFYNFTSAKGDRKTFWMCPSCEAYVQFWSGLMTVSNWPLTSIYFWQWFYLLLTMFYLLLTMFYLLLTMFYLLLIMFYLLQAVPAELISSELVNFRPYKPGTSDCDCFIRRPKWSCLEQ